MFELVIKQKRNTYTEDHKYFSENLNELFDMVQMSIKLSKFEISYVIRELTEGENNED